MDRKSPIFVVEPQCWELEHASVNAALMDMIIKASAGIPVIFMGEKGHLKNVREILEHYDQEGYRKVEWQEIALPPRKKTGWLRFFHERSLFAQILKFAVNFRARQVLFTSLTNTGVLALKILLLLRHFSFPVMGIIHAILNTVVGRWPHKPWNWPLNLRVVLRLPHPRQLQFLVPGQSILNSLRKLQPALVKPFRAIDLPYFEFDKSPQNQVIQGKPENLLFGFLGTGSSEKGFDLFAGIAKSFSEFRDRVSFTLVGKLSENYYIDDYSYLKDVTHKTLESDDFRNRAIKLTYVINTSNPLDYRFIASASFLDALFYGKPGIYLRNSYVEYYFEMMGDIGYLCDSVEEMTQVVSEIIEQFPVTRYRQQVENIQRERKVLTPGVLAPRMNALLLDQL